MKTYEIKTDIAASRDAVWDVLINDLPLDPQPFGILRLQGTLSPGARVKLWSEVSPNRAFDLRVDELQKPAKMVWRGGMPLGLFTGTRTFTLTADETGTHFHMKEVFSGPLSGMITKSMPDLKPSFAKFAQTLKSKAETK